MIELINENKYLSSDVIEQCFKKGETNYIDKVVTGNGFTTGFSYLKPAFNKVNVLIAPNKSVVKDKELEHSNGKFAPSKRVAFVYEGSGLKGSANDYDLIVLVSDSFVNFAYKLQGKVDKLMVDEFHSVIIQSAFRYKLKKLIYTLQDDFTNCSIAFVTASPLLYSKIDIQIKNKYVNDKILHTSNNIQESILRCVNSIKQGKKVIIFSQDSAIIKRILKDSNRNDFRLIAGESFTTTLLSKEIYRLNNNSNIVVCSSAAFEGWSDYSIDGDVYIYMNLGNSTNTFLGANIYQAIGRLREGYNYAECCVVDLGGGGFPNKIITELEQKIDKFIAIDNVPIERKQSRTFSYYYKSQKVVSTDLMSYIYYKRDKNVYTLHKYYPAIDVHNEIKQIDTRLKLYTDYFNTRKIQLVNVDFDITKKRLTTRIRREQRVEHITTNIRDNNLEDSFLNFFFKSHNPANVSDYYIEEIDVMQEVAFNLGIELDSKYEVLKQYLNDGYHAELKNIFIESKMKKGYGRDKIRQEIKRYTSDVYPYTVEVAIGITFDRLDRYIVGHRDYNKLTKIGISQIKFIADKLGLYVTEVDIKNCFPRILYALNGLELPNDFYGEDRAKSKKKINTALNCFRYDKTKYRSESKQRSDSRRLLDKAGISEQCIDWLMLNHFNNDFKGDFFNYLAYHERCVIGAAMDLISIYEPDVKMYRRHDSFIVFSELSYRCLDDFSYLNQSGWFDSYEINEDDDLFN
jgi:hypothetical protein